MFWGCQRNGLWDALDEDQVRRKNWPRSGIERNECIPSQPCGSFFRCHQRQHYHGQHDRVKRHYSVFKSPHHHIREPNHKVSQTFVWIRAFMASGELDVVFTNPNLSAFLVTVLVSVEFGRSHDAYYKKHKCHCMAFRTCVDSGIYRYSRTLVQYPLFLHRIPCLSRHVLERPSTIGATAFLTIKKPIYNLYGSDVVVKLTIPEAISELP